MKWPLLLALLCATPATAQTYMPARAFWRAYDQLSTAKSADDSARIIFHNYENEGSPGHDLFMSAAGSTFDFLEHIKARKSYLDWWRRHSIALDSVPAMLARTTASFQRLLPGAKAPVFVVAVGRLNSSFMTFDSGYTGIAIDKFLPALNPPVQDLTQDQRSTLRPFNDITRAAAVAMTDLNRKAPFEHAGEELLSQALTAGVEELIAELVAGAPWASAAIEFGRRNESELWREFQADRRAGLPTGKWFGPATRARPSQIGRYVGYRIAQRFVEVSGNRTAALHRLLEGGNPLDVLKVSGYESDE